MANKIVRAGSTGTWVELLQLALDRAGFSPGLPDGIFGSLTLSALQNFQRSRSLTPDGIAGSRTWNAITPYLTGYIRHTVRQGDTLYRLAMANRTTIRQIEASNPSVDPLSLQVGSVLTIPLGFDVVPVNISFTPTVLDYCVDGLKARYPFLSTGSIGKSVMGKTIPYIVIGNGGNSVLYNASHHANEWIVSPLLMKFLENYAKAVALGGRIWGQDAVQLYSGTKLHIVPMVNPDGVSLVTGELDSGSYYNSARQIAANYPSIPFVSGWKANIQGIDLNLQYPAGWDEARRIKFAQGFTSPAPRDYVGTAPLTAPESLAMYEYTRQNDFTLSLSYHTQGEVIYWKFLDYNPPGSYEIAEQFAAVSGYLIETTPYASGFAGYKDWFIQTYNRPGYTIEAGEGVAPLPLSQFEQIFNDNIGILTLGLAVTK